MLFAFDDIYGKAVLKKSGKFIYNVMIRFIGVFLIKKRRPVRWERRSLSLFKLLSLNERLKTISLRSEANVHHENMQKSESDLIDHQRILFTFLRTLRILARAIVECFFSLIDK